jgi:RNA polymerase sigma-70 factor (ECF subfamily)
VNAALEKAWTDVASKIRGYIRSRLRDHAAAEDILQDVFLKAHLRIGQLQSPEKLEGWLFLIARNAVSDHFRKSKPVEQLPEEIVGEASGEPGFENECQLRAAFRRMIAELPAPYGEALVLTEFEGLTQKQLADRLGISLSGAKSRVQRGREKLKEALLDCCRFEFDRRGSIIDCMPKQDDCCTHSRVTGVNSVSASKSMLPALRQPSSQRAGRAIPP